MTLEIIIYRPPVELSPNCRCHWVKKSKAGKNHRTHTTYLARERLRVAQGWDRNKKVRVDHCWDMSRAQGLYGPRDEQNAISSLKWAFDGLTDAGVVIDDRHQCLKVGDFSVCKDGSVPKGCIKLTVTQIE